MNCRALNLHGMTQPFAAWTFFFLFSITAYGENSSVNWKHFQTQSISIQPDSSGQGSVLSTYPSWMQLFYTHWLSWEPRVNSLDSLKNGACRLSFSSENLKNRVQEFGRFQNEKPDCIYVDAENKSPSLLKVLKALSVKFDLSDRGHFRKVLFTLPTAQHNKIVVRGLFGIHDDQKARPLLILRMGVHGNVDEFLAERFFAKAAFEDFDFNFLALENLTSHGYLSEPNPLTFGGVDEGLQTYLIIEQLKMKSSVLSSLISDIHLVGISLGAHGVFFSTMLDEVNGHHLKSASVFCPVVNLQPTLQFHSQKSLESALVDLWNRRRLKAVPERFPELDHTEWWKTFFDLKPRFMPAILDYLEVHQNQPAEKIPDGFRWPDGLQSHMQNSKTFSQMNSFWPFFKNQKIPLLIVTTAKDIIVSEQLNADQIFLKKQPGDFSRTEFIKLDQGVHCGLPPDFQWSYILNLLRIQWN